MNRPSVASLLMMVASLSCGATAWGQDAASTGTEPSVPAAVTPGPVSNALQNHPEVTGQDVLDRVRGWNNSGPVSDDIQVYAQAEGGRILIPDADEVVLGINVGGQVRVQDRVAVGFDYVYASGLFGPSGSVASPYVSLELRDKEAHPRFQPFVAVGPGWLQVHSGSQSPTVHASVGASLQLTEHLGLRGDVRLSQPLDTVRYDSNLTETTYTYQAKDIHLVQTRLGLNLTW